MIIENKAVMGAAISEVSIVAPSEPKPSLEKTVFQLSQVKE